VWNIYAIIPFAACIAYIALIAVVANRSLSRVHKVFILLATVSALWSFGSFTLHADILPAQTMNVNRALILFGGSVPVVYYHFVRVFFNRPVGKVTYLGYAWLVGWAIYIYQGGVLISSYVADGILFWEYDATFYLFSATLSAYMVAAIFYLVQGFRRSNDPLVRNRVGYLLAAFIIWMIFAMTNFVPTLSNYSVDHIGAIFFALIISYTILRYQLLNIRFVVRRGLTWVILISAVVGTYLGVILLSFNLMAVLSLTGTIVLAAVAALALALAVRPLKFVIQGGIDRLFYRGTYNYRQALLDYSKRMSNVIKLEELAREMLSVITKALNIKEAKLLFQDISSGDFVTQFTYPALGGELASEIKFNADNPIVSWIGKTDTPLNVSLIEKVPEFKGLWQSEKEQIAASNTRLICPIKNDGNLVGILALGRKEPDALYSQEDLGSGNDDCQPGRENDR
jgi:hypothetical protein